MVRSRPGTLKLTPILSPRTRYKGCRTQAIYARSTGRNCWPIFFKYCRNFSTTFESLGQVRWPKESNYIYSRFCGGFHPKCVGFKASQELILRKIPLIILQYGRASFYEIRYSNPFFIYQLINKNVFRPVTVSRLVRISHQFCQASHFMIQI